MSFENWWLKTRHIFPNVSEDDARSIWAAALFFGDRSEPSAKDLCKDPLDCKGIPLDSDKGKINTTP